MLCSAFTLTATNAKFPCEEEARVGDRCVRHSLGRDRYGQAVGIACFVAFGKGGADLMKEGHELVAALTAARKVAMEGCRAALDAQPEKAREAFDRARNQAAARGTPEPSVDEIIAAVGRCIKWCEPGPFSIANEVARSWRRFLPGASRGPDAKPITEGETR